MAETPGKRRRKGREAFIPLEDPMDHQPYEPGTWAHKMHLSDWLEGWKEAEEAYEAKAHHVDEEFNPGDDPCSMCRCRTCLNYEPCALD